MNIERAIFNRSRRLMGDEAFKRLEDVRVIIFGVGGVGSWAAESLVRTGVRHLTIVDSDCVCATNINRQLMATTKTIGEVKVDAMRRHLLEINPEADIRTIQDKFTEGNAASFRLDDYDFIIDAIDSLRDKAALIECATRTRAHFFSSMGAALKMDPTRVQVAEFWNVKGCPLARALRQRFKRTKRFPVRKFRCVYSDELLPNLGVECPCGVDASVCPKAAESYQSGHDACAGKAQVNGSLMHITAIFGLTLAGLVIQEIYSGSGN